MNWGMTGILIVFGAFVLLLILNPNMSCFGKRIRSPFYPLLRKKNAKKKAGQAPGDKAAKKAQDYGFRLD